MDLARASESFSLDAVSVAGRSVFHCCACDIVRRRGPLLTFSGSVQSRHGSHPKGCTTPLSLITKKAFDNKSFNRVENVNTSMGYNWVIVTTNSCARDTLTFHGGESGSRAINSQSISRSAGFL